MRVKRKINTEECLLALLREAIAPVGGRIGQVPETEADWTRLMQLAEAHAVSSLLYGVLVEKQKMPEPYREKLERTCHSTVLQSYRLLFLGRAIIEELSAARIPALILKGSSLAALYPVPELRKSGDVDILLLQPEQMEAACAALQAVGFVPSRAKQPRHHSTLVSPEGIEAELHTLLAEPFGNRHVDRFVQESMRIENADIVWEDVMGIGLPRLADAQQAFAMLLHMLQHYLRTGFGLKLLCDWTVFWNHPHGQAVRETYLRMVRVCGLKGFSDMVTAACVYRLGLRKERVAFMFADDGLFPARRDADELLREVLEAGEFGEEREDRMVALWDSSVAAYAREFHRQMRLNFPKAGRIVLCWPLLWLLTLLRFLYNNRTVRHVSARTLLHKAGQRGRLSKKMRLFAPEGL